MDAPTTRANPYTPGVSGLLIEKGIGWIPHAHIPGWVSSAEISDYVAEIVRLVETNAALTRDAQRWRALMHTARIRLWGWAGFGDAGRPADDTGYRHMGLELWSLHGNSDPNEVGTVKGRTLLRDYADALAATMAIPERDEVATLTADKAKLSRLLKITERALCIVLGMFRNCIPQRNFDLIWQSSIDDIDKASTMPTEKACTTQGANV